MSTDIHIKDQGHAWPKFKWHWQFLLTAIPFILSIFSEFDITIFQRAILLLLPVAIPTAIWLTKVLWVANKRTNGYDKLYDQYVRVLEDLNYTRQNIFEIFSNYPQGTPHHLSKAVFYNGRLYISIERLKNYTPEVGDMVLVADKEDAMLMGIFDVEEVRQNDFVAKARPGIDAVFLGYVREHVEINVVPGLFALVFEGGKSNDQ